MCSRDRVLALVVGVVVAVVAAALLFVPDRSPERSGSGAGRAGGRSSGPARGPALRQAGFAVGSGILSAGAADLGRDLDAMVAAGARWLRFDFAWPAVEEVRGRRDWSAVDRVVDAAHGRGMRIVALPTYTPAWARPRGTTQFHPPDDPSTFAGFVRAAVQRYSPRGVKVWEVWNEPNIRQFWKPQADPPRYATLLRATAVAVHTADPSATVLTGGLAPGPDRPSPSGMSPMTFLTALYKAGARGTFDGVAVHPYSYPAPPNAPSEENTFFALPRLHELMDANGDGHKRIWSTEFGAPTAGLRSVTEAAQVQFVRQAYEAVARWPWSGPLLWFSLRDRGTDPSEREDHFGLLRNDRSRKPAYEAFVAVAKRRTLARASPPTSNVAGT